MNKLKARTTVGASDRTLGKHKLLNQIVGREAGILRLHQPCFLSPPWHLYDLCAGDGQPTDQSGTSSAAILLKHCKYLEGKAYLTLIERDNATFSVLQQHYGHLPEVTVLNTDSRYFSIPDGTIGKSNPVFLHNDPNKVHDWALNNKLLFSCSKYVTTLSTLGCNVGGLKKLPYPERLRWFDHVNNVLQVLPSWHDAAICCLRGDASQWAYLLTGPQRWRKQYQEDIRRAFNYWVQGYDLAWYRDEETFDRLLQKLFLTKEEMECA